jgi:hypothetical protein
MPANRNTPRQTVARAQFAKIPKAAYIAAFAISSGVAYWWAVAGKPATASHPESSSTALVHILAPTTVKLDRADVRQQVLSQANVERAARQIDDGASSGAASTSQRTPLEWRVRLQEKLLVDVGADNSPGATRVSIAYADENARAAAQGVNSLADSFAEGFRRQWRSQAEMVYRDAHDAAGRAADDLRRATARLNAFSPQVAPLNPSLVDNPDWLELNRQLANLQQRRDRLLVDRTSLHPEVQAAEVRIADLKRRLAASERWIPARQSAATPPESIPPGQPTAAAEGAASFEKLRDAVARSQQASEKAARAEQRAWQARQQEPQIELQLAQAPCAPPLYWRLRLALASLAAGMTTTVGLGMIATGAAIEPTVNSLAQLGAVLSVPVLGVVPATDRIKSARAGRSGLLRMLWIGMGLVVIVSCAAAMLLRA